jgi:prepilin-type processing-associated H-X9-DG protein
MRFPNSLWFFLFLILIVLFSILIPALFKVNAIAQRVICQDYMKNLWIAAEIYKKDCGGEYPNSGQWYDLLIQETEVSPKFFHCPRTEKNSFSYALNESLYVVGPNEVFPNMVMLFEADLGRNGVGGANDLVLRHKQNDRIGCNIVYTDGHVEFVTEDRIADLQWTAE